MVRAARVDCTRQLLQSTAMLMVDLCCLSVQPARREGAAATLHGVSLLQLWASLSVQSTLRRP